MTLIDQPLHIGRSVPQLNRFGLSADADLIYRTLVTLGSVTARRLHTDLELSMPRVLSALESLDHLGAVVHHDRAHHRDTLWHPRSPDHVLRTLSEQRTRELRKRAPTALPVERPNELGPGLVHLPSRAAVRERLRGLVSAIRSEFLSMHPEVQFSPAAVAAAAETDHALLRRQLRLRTLGVHHVPADQTWPVEPVADNNYRNAIALPMKLLVLDRRVALFPVDPNDIDRGYLEVSQPPVVQSLVQLFQQQWDAAHEPEIDMPALFLGSREQALVDLLVAGHTDASAARELQISERTVTTTMRGLMDRLHVNNRFQLGVTLGAFRAVAPSTELPSPPIDRKGTTS